MLDKIKYVLMVYQERSFTRAAEKLFVSQAAISKMIKQVEAEIGVPIFDRSTIPFTLTTEGEIYISYARKISHLDEDLRSYFSDIHNLKTGSLTVGGSSFFCSFLLPDLLGAFSRRYPNISIRMQEGNVAMLRSGLEDESIDLIVETAFKDTDSFLNTYYLYSEDIVLAVPADFAINNSLKAYQLTYEKLQDDSYMGSAASISLEKFASLPFILLTEGNDLLPRSISLCKEAKFIPKIMLQVDQILTATNLCASGLGVTFTRPAVTQCYPFSKKICFYRIGSTLAKRKIYLASKNSRYVNSAMSAFLKIALKNFSHQRSDL